jgi:hypothetical protein
VTATVSTVSSEKIDLDTNRGKLFLIVEEICYGSCYSYPSYKMICKRPTKDFILLKQRACERNLLLVCNEFRLMLSLDLSGGGQPLLVRSAMGFYKLS